MKPTLKTNNENPRAAILSKYAGPTNARGSRIIVSSQRGRKSFSYPYELSGSDCHAWAVDQYLKFIIDEDKIKYGENATGWGDLADFSIGQLKSGEYVFVSNK